ncbi:MAG: hypothetical protein JNK57_04985 [Planctomycetaceae bacterium]|nr:hypothetical protein [Planctomycetaceae bacterium]
MKELPGVPFERFEAGVRALVELRDRGKFLVFLARRRSAQLIGPSEEFIQRLSAELNLLTLEASDASEVFEEIRQFLSSRIGMHSDRVVSFLLNSVYDDKDGKLSAGDKQRLRETLKKKVALVEQELYTPSLQTREQRFGSTTAACLEDLEFELLSERSSASQKDPFRDPFLRLRLRYSKGTEDVQKFGFLNFWGPNPFATSELHSFEFECDESDIDLLMLRLTAAKRRLLASREEKSANG